MATKTLHIDEELHVKLKIMAAIEGVQLQDVVERLIKKGVEVEEKEAKTGKN